MFALDNPSADPILCSVAERPDLRHAIAALDAVAFPAFMAHTDLAARWPHIYAEFPEYQVALCDPDSGRHLAHANGVPFVWDGYHSSLPRTATEMVGLALQHKRRGLRPNTLGALQVVVDPGLQRRGLSSRMLLAYAARTVEVGLTSLFAPIRPTLKARYPLTRLDSYVKWQRADGETFDPWQRVHARLGAVPAGIAERWLTVRATPAQWSHWTGVAFPVSGTYVVPGALEPVAIDLERNIGAYIEPHLWMHYRLAHEPAAASRADQRVAA